MKDRVAKLLQTQPNSGAEMGVDKYDAQELLRQADIDRFRAKETKIFARMEMHGVGYWVPTEEPLAGRTLIYLLRHESREAAKEHCGAAASHRTANRQTTRRLDVDTIRARLPAQQGQGLRVGFFQAIMRFDCRQKPQLRSKCCERSGNPIGCLIPWTGLICARC
jgi:hypothetical protein